LTLKEGSETGIKINAHDHLECSARTKDNVRAVFETATRAALTAKSKKKKGGCALL